MELSSDARREVVALMAGEGLSERAIAAAVGVSQPTVHRDLGQVIRAESRHDADDSEPAPPVTGLDGKTYGKRQGRHAAYPLTATFRRRLKASRAAVIKLCNIAGSDKFDPGSLADDADAIRPSNDGAISALTEVRARFDVAGEE